MDQLFKSIIALVTGGAIWEVIKFIYPEIKRYFDGRKFALDSFYKNLDPILKSASELYGKLESLAKEDFSTFINPSSSISIDVEHNKKYIYYLFAQFWGHLENLRLESQYTSLSKISKGKHLLRFIETFESRKFRILDRSMQRIIGECLINQKDQKFRVLTLNEFMVQYGNKDSNLHKQVINLQDFFNSVNNKKIRQRVLVYGVIIASLIDYFDPKYKIVRRRNIYSNKLSLKSKRIIEFHLVRHYIGVLKNKKQYYQ